MAGEFVAAGMQPATPEAPAVATPVPGQATPDPAQQAQAAAAEPDWIEIPDETGAIHTRVDRSRVPELWMTRERERQRLVQENQQLKAQQQRPAQAPANERPAWIPIAEEILTDLRTERPDADPEDLKAIAKTLAKRELRNETRTESRIAVSKQEAQFNAINAQVQQQYGVDLTQDPTFLNIYHSVQGTVQDHVDLWRVRTGRFNGNGAGPTVPATTTGINGAVNRSGANGSLYGAPPGGGAQAAPEMSAWVQQYMSRFDNMNLTPQQRAAYLQNAKNLDPTRQTGAF